jgi:solute carrier family 25 2-oxodicarboxylate transporter 21
MNQQLSILTGATAGATEAFVVVPFELVKIRLQDRASAGKYNGMVDCVMKIVKAEGPLALYNGLEYAMEARTVERRIFRLHLSSARTYTESKG